VEHGLNCSIEDQDQSVGKIVTEARISDIPIEEHLLRKIDKISGVLDRSNELDAAKDAQMSGNDIKEECKQTIQEHYTNECFIILEVKEEESEIDEVTLPHPPVSSINKVLTLKLENQNLSNRLFTLTLK
jgi:hypothetical protein